MFRYSKNRAFCHELPDMSVHGWAVLIVALSVDSRYSTWAPAPHGRPSWVTLFAAPVIVHR